MDTVNKLYPEFYNPLLFEPGRSLPKEVAVLGAGNIGPDIGYYLKTAIPGLKLVLVDVVESALKTAEARMQGYVDKAVKKKKMDREQGDRVLENIVYTTDYEAIKNCELVIEAATEDLGLKKKIFAQVEELVGPDTIIASNTSSIPAERMFSELKDAGRATITHFFAPAWMNLAVEVITWEKVDREIVDYLCWFFCKTGKTPIVSESVICFILVRVFNNWANEAGYLLEIADADQIDHVAETYAATGPFFVLNLAHSNVIHVETNTLLMEEGEHYLPAKIFKSVDYWMTKERGAAMDVPANLREPISDRLLGAVFSQAFDIVDRGIGTIEDTNLGCQLGLGFKQGPFDMMRECGEHETARIIERLQKERPGFPGPKKEFSHYQSFNRHILTDVVDGVKIITIRRPQFFNALNDEVNNEILTAIKQDEDNADIKGFVITGYGERAFCAGAEIGRFPELLGDFEAATQYARDCSGLLEYIDTSKKPIVAAVNGMALGGGLEIAIRCHSMVATKNAIFQFPEITLGISPGIGGCVVPYRKWPESSKIFHDMIRFGKALNVQEAEKIGMVKKSTEDYLSMIKAAVQETRNLEGNVQKIPDGEVSIEPIERVERPAAGELPLSPEAVGIVDEIITEAAAAGTFQEALEIGYQGSGRISCTDAAKEGIAAFQEKRPPKFKS